MVGIVWAVKEQFISSFFSQKLCEVIGSQYGRVASLATIDDAGTQNHIANLIKRSGLYT